MNEPEIRFLKVKNLAGLNRRMSLKEDATRELWQQFMPRRNEINGRIGNDYYSVQLFDPATSIDAFTQDTQFTKWATVEVSQNTSLPEGMLHLLIPEGQYAVFLHRGGPEKAAETFGYIFGKWLPASPYQADNRPHFEVLGDKYKHNSPDSEEEIWIPVRPKQNQ